MADMAFRPTPPATTLAGPNWGAIWAGMFSFVAIWAVFGLLGEAIFASAANANSAQPVGGGIDWGFAIWSIILTIIAMYVGGRVTGALSGVATHRAAVLQGQVMFGLSVIGAMIIIVLAGTALSGGTGVNANTTSAWSLSIFSGLGWTGFLSLLFGWLAAMGGAAHGLPTARATVRDRDNVRDIRAA
jgi:hypothetical protein